MNIKEERFLNKKGAYVIDFNNVDFITYTQNEDKPERWQMKFHMGAKEARYMTKSLDETITILENWASSKSMKNIFFNKEEIEYTNRRY